MSKLFLGLACAAMLALSACSDPLMTLGSSSSVAEGLHIQAPFTDTFDYNMGVSAWAQSGSGGSFTVQPRPDGLGKAAYLSVNNGDFVVKRRFCGSDLFSLDLFPGTLTAGLSQSLTISLVSNGITLGSVVMGANGTDIQPHFSIGPYYGWTGALQASGSTQMGFNYDPTYNGDSTSYFCGAFTMPNGNVSNVVFAGSPQPGYAPCGSAPDNFLVVEAKAVGTSFSVMIDNVELSQASQ